MPEALCCGNRLKSGQTTPAGIISAAPGGRRFRTSIPALANNHAESPAESPAAGITTTVAVLASGIRPSATANSLTTQAQASVVNIVAAANHDVTSLADRARAWPASRNTFRRRS